MAVVMHSLARDGVLLLALTLALPMACRDSSKSAATEGDDEPKKKKKASVEEDDDTPTTKKKKKKPSDDEDEAPKKKKKYVEGPLGFPLPKDAGSKSNAPGGGGKIFMYEVPRARDEVADELEKLLEEAGWTIDAKEKSPMGSRRMTASKDGTTVKASVAVRASSPGSS